MFLNLIKTIFLIFIIFNSVNAQQLDSLLRVIPGQKEDTIKVNNYAMVAYLYSFSNQEQAKKYHDSALILSKKIGFLSGEGQAYQGIGEYYYFQKNWQKMKSNLQKSQSIFLKIDDQRRYNSIKSIYALFYEKTGDLEQALKMKIELLNFYEKTNEKTGQAQMLGSIALLLSRMKRFEEAKEYYLESINLRKKINDKRGESIMLLNLGAMLSEQKKPDDALFYLNKCIELQKNLQDQIILTSAELNLAKVYNEKKAFEKSLKLSERCLEIYKKIPDSLNIAIARFYIAESHMGLKQYNQSIQQLDSVVISDYNKFLYTELHTLYYKTYKEMNQFSKALDHLETIRKIEQENNLSEIQNKISELKEQYETEKKELENQKLKKTNEINQLQLNNNRYIIISITLLSLFIVVILFLIIRYNKIKSREKNLQLQQKLLLSQMNPHFMFNALSSIQNYMYANDSEKAGDFLSSFARLSRGILDHSQAEAIFLEKEIQWLNDYIKLQQLRFDNEVEFTLSIDNTIDVFSTLVPPMLVQPFVENAFEHGLRNINHKGLLSINYKKENNLIIVQIQDNGSGFTHNKKEEQRSSHVSKAIKITKERLALLNKGKSNKVQINVDSKPETGTTISFTIPLITLK